MYFSIVITITFTIIVLGETVIFLVNQILYNHDTVMKEYK